MRRPIFYVVDDDKTDRELIEVVLKRHPLKPLVKTFAKAEFLFNHLQSLEGEEGPTAIFSDFWLNRSGHKTDYNTGAQVFENYRTSWKHRNTAGIILTGSMSDHMRAELFHHKYVDEVVEKNALIQTSDERSSSRTNALDKLISQRLFSQPINIGVIGLGAMGVRSIAAALHQTDPRGNRYDIKVRVFSNFWKNDNEEHFESLDNLMGIHSDSSKLEKYRTLEGFFKDLDLALITTGPFRNENGAFDRSRIKSRRDVENWLLHGAAPKVREIYAAADIQKFNGMFVDITNPVGAVLGMGYELQQKWKNKLTSIAPDHLRINSQLYALERENIERVFGRNADESLIRNIMVYGDHGSEFGLLDNCYLQQGRAGENIPLKEINSRYADESFRIQREEEIAARSRSLGVATLKSEATWNQASEDTRRALEQTIRDIASYQIYPSFSMHTFVEGEKVGAGKKDYGYLLTPAQIHYDNSTITCRPDYKVENLPSRWTKDLQEQIFRIEDLLKEYKEKS